MKSLNLIKRYAWLVIFLIFNNAIMVLMTKMGTVSFESRYYVLYLGFSYAQFGLVAIWFSFSATRWWIRLPIAILAPLGCMFLIMLCDTDFDYRDHEFEVFYGPSLILSIAVGTVLRPFIGTVGQQTERDKNRLAQITLLTLLGWTAAVAVAIAILVSRWKLYELSESTLDYSLLQMSMAAFAVNVMIGFFLYSRQPIITSIVAIIFSLIVAAGTICFLHGVSSLASAEDLWHFGMIYFSQTAMMLTTVAAARLAGYRPTYAVNIREETAETTT